MTQPDADDVVVRQKRGTPTAVYVLGTPLGPAQLQVCTRDEAVAHARAFAKHQYVRAWFAAGGVDFVLLGTVRKEKVEPAKSS
jgi:hypothetical protein